MIAGLLCVHIYGSTTADAAVISRRMRGSMNYTGKPAYEICPAGQMKAQLTLQ